jgi:hypothetical protein
MSRSAPAPPAIPSGRAGSSVDSCPNQHEEIAMTLGSRPRPDDSARTYTVQMESRGNERFIVEDRLDAEFLELADEFAMKARRILAENPRKTRRRARR